MHICLTSAVEFLGVIFERVVLGDGFREEINCTDSQNNRSRSEGLRYSWYLALSKAIRALNSRVVIHLEAAPSESLLGASPSPMSSALDPKVLSATLRVVESWIDQLINPTQRVKAVKQWINYRAQTHDQMRRLPDQMKKEEAARYNTGVREIVLPVWDLVMLFQKDTAKLESLWRGPFRSSEYEQHGI